MRIFTSTAFVDFSKLNISQIQERFQELKLFRPSSSLYHVPHRPFELPSQRNQSTSESNIESEPLQFVDGEEHQPGKETSRCLYMVSNDEKKNRRLPFWWMVVKVCFDYRKFDWSFWGHSVLRYHEGEIGWMIICVNHLWKNVNVSLRDREQHGKDSGFELQIFTPVHNLLVLYTINSTKIQISSTLEYSSPLPACSIWQHFLRSARLWWSVRFSDCRLTISFEARCHH